MKKLITSLILITVLLTACASPAATGPVDGAVTAVTGAILQPVIQVTPTAEISATPEVIIPQPINHNNFIDLVKNVDYTQKVGELAGKSYAELAIDIVAYSPDGRYVAFGGCTGNWTGHCQNDVFGPSDSFIYILDAVTAEFVSDVPERKTTISGLSFSRDGNKLAYATSPFKVAVWDIPSGTTDIVFSQEEDGSSYGKVTFSPNSDMVAFVFDEFLYVWSYPEGKLLTKSPAFWYAVDFPQFSADGKKLAVFTQNYGKAIAVYDTVTWKVLTQIAMPGGGAHRAAFSEDGKLLASVEGANNANIYLWDAETGGQIGILDEPIMYIDAMDFTPDGKFLFTSGYSTDALIVESYSIWDVAEKKYLGGLMADKSASRIYFSEDGLTFFDGEGLWGAPGESMLAARQVLEDYLSVLNQGDYQKAAESFMVQDYILKWYVDEGYDTSNIPLMLETVCASPDQLCLPVISIRNGGIDIWGEYLFIVQFANSDGSTYTDADGNQNIWVFVAPDADGNFKVIGWPL